MLSGITNSAQRGFSGSRNMLSGIINSAQRGESLYLNIFFIVRKITRK
jgi:hypothetical protein